LQNYPNPFNPETWIPYKLADASDVVIKIYNVSGQTIRTLHLGHKDAGVYLSRERSAYWDGKNDADETIASGIYFYSIQAGKYTAVRRMVVVR
jgi:flagellar hook assembly protein FlgD